MYVPPASVDITLNVLLCKHIIPLQEFPKIKIIYLL